MADDWTGSGYDRKPSDGGIWLRLKDKGEEIRIRLVSQAERYLAEFDDKEKGGKVTRRKIAWLAIHKYLDADKKPVKRVVIFDSGPMVYGLIRDLTMDESWGDPTTYDLKVTRTEESGRYYTVLPCPKPMGPISTDERKLVEEARINFPGIIRGDPDGDAAQADIPSEDTDPFGEPGEDE